MSLAQWSTNKPSRSTCRCWNLLKCECACAEGVVCDWTVVAGMVELRAWCGSTSNYSGLIGQISSPFNLMVLWLGRFAFGRMSSYSSSPFNKINCTSIGLVFFSFSGRKQEMLFLPSILIHNIQNICFTQQLSTGSSPLCHRDLSFIILECISIMTCQENWIEYYQPKLTLLIKANLNHDKTLLNKF